MVIEDEAVRRHVDRWADRVARRIHAHDPARPVWDRKRFLLELWADRPDHPPRDAVELTDAFEPAVREAHGSAARFRVGLDHQLGRSEPVTTRL